MGLSMLSRSGGHEASLAAQQTLQGRFGAHFPRLFAYVYSYVGDATAAREIVADAFIHAFACCPDFPDSTFRLVLFETARGRCRAAVPAKAPFDGLLSPREREVISLLFDAQLSRREVGRLLKIGEDAVTSALMRGLKKLRAAAPAILAAYLRPT